MLLPQKDIRRHEKMNLHVGIIPDGNRRYAVKSGKSIESVYSDEISQLERALFCSTEFPDITQLTIYVCSIDNLKQRTKDYLEALYAFLRSRFQTWLDSKGDFRVRCVGHYREYLPQDLLALISELELKTLGRSGRKINLAVGYDGREDILDAVKHADNMGLYDKLTVDIITQHLEVSQAMDLVVRSGKEKRMSSFFPWQCVYSEWFFEEKLWPEMTIDDFKRILVDYSQRERRFGK